MTPIEYAMKHANNPYDRVSHSTVQIPWASGAVEGAIANAAMEDVPVRHGTIDLVVTSPPYNVGLEYDKDDDSMSYDDYLLWMERWLGEAYDWLAQDGRLCLNIPLDKNAGGKQAVGADIIHLATRGIGFGYHSTIVWHEPNISKRTAWGSWMSASAPHVIAPVELIVVLYKYEWKKQKPGESDITRNEFMEWTNGLWKFNGEKPNGHPAPFPLELPRRCVKLFSFVGDLVLDPFMGSGTTLVAALQNKRHALGIDISEEYCRLAERRIGAIQGGLL